MAGWHWLHLAFTVSRFQAAPDSCFEGLPTPEAVAQVHIEAVQTDSTHWQTYRNVRPGPVVMDIATPGQVARALVSVVDSTGNESCPVSTPWLAGQTLSVPPASDDPQPKLPPHYIDLAGRSWDGPEGRLPNGVYWKYQPELKRRKLIVVLR